MKELLLNPEIEFHRLFGFFLNKKGVNPKFRKTKYGYRTYDGVWRLFTDSLSITRTQDVKVYNGYDYDNSYEETKYKIEQTIDLVTHVHFLYKKIF